MRDFLYNKGDVLITILIILVAATVIFFRVGIVMGNSDPGERIKILFAPLLSSGREDEDPSDVAAINEEPPANITAEEPVKAEPPAAEQPKPEEQAPVEEEPVEQTKPPPEPPAASTSGATITINAGDAASTIADKLLAAGAISDKQAFLTEVIAQKADSKLKQGTFSIPAGSSVNEIIAILVG